MQKGFVERLKENPGIPGMGREQDPVVIKAMEKAFEGIDLDKMNEEFIRDIKKRM